RARGVVGGIGCSTPPPWFAQDDRRGARTMIPLSFAQRRMWLLHQLQGAAESYNMSAAFRLTGSLDKDALVAAIGDVIVRHEILRTVYVTDARSEEHTSELQSRENLVCRLLL